ncbi:hypothetical protein RJT34_14042 [Clitoria ternatea]|uniref:Transcription regulator mTERF family n=1 Tax=Clitoria ternatea TaxID=43366 RepID=A0AAN9PM21_CLITE
MFHHCRRALLCLNPNPIILTSKPFSSSSKSHPFTYNYFLNTLGFTPETAFKLSTRLRLTNSARPDSVIALFRTHGFSNSLISSIIKAHPLLLSFRPTETILPKLDFFLQRGASSSDLMQIATKNPRFLYFGLKNSITPRYNLIKSFLLSHDSTLHSVKSCPAIVYSKNPHQNIQVLIHNGVPESKVALLLRYWASTLLVDPSVFKLRVEKVKNLGFDPKSSLFVVAVRVSKTMWERKIGLYKKWGWSEDVVVSAFLKYPWCMLASEQKIEAMMEFCVNHLGWESLVLAKNPVLIMLSLEKRIIPRALVLQALHSKGLIKNANSAGHFQISEKTFLQKYVNGFAKEASHLLRLYEGGKEFAR